MMKRTRRSEREKMKKAYPSAELLYSICYADYQRIHSTYDRIYEKVNIGLVFSGVILVVIVSSIDLTIFQKMWIATPLELFSLITFSACSIGSTVLILWAVIQLLLLLRSRSLQVFDSSSIQSEQLYKEQPEVAALWIIEKYTKSIADSRRVIESKQKTYDRAILKMIISIILFSVALIIKKGM